MGIFFANSVVLQPTMSCLGLARQALAAPEWVRAWDRVGANLKRKLELNDLAEPIVWSGIRGGRDAVKLMLGSLDILSAEASKAEEEVDMCMNLISAARPVGRDWVERAARLPDLALAIFESDREKKRKSEEVDELLSKLQRPEVLAKPIEWKGRRYRRAELAGDERARKKAEQRARDKASKRVVEILVESGLPFGLEYAQKGWSLSSPEAARCLKGLRPTTLKKRAADIGPFLRYIWGLYGIRWPESKDVVLEYLGVRAEEKAAKSIYRMIHVEYRRRL